MSDETWYVRRGTRIRGPFPATVLLRALTAGRLLEGDQVSHDLRQWMPPAALVAQASPSAQSPRGDGLASSPAPTMAPRSAYVARLLAQRDNRALQVLMVGAMVVAVVVAGVGLDSQAPVPHADCAAPAGPGVNWSSCNLGKVALDGADLRGATLRGAQMAGSSLRGARLPDADLAYVDLSGGSLAYAGLARVNLMGANLNGADISNADLHAANLSYTNFTNADIGGARLDGANLDNAIWIDGSLCRPGSTGRCESK